MELLVPFAILTFLGSMAKGATGAAAGIVFNAGLLIAVVTGWVPEDGLITGLLMLAITNFFTSAYMALQFRREIKFERLTVYMMLGLIPVTMIFSLLLTKIDVFVISLVLAVAVIGGGVYLLTQTKSKPWSKSLTEKLAFPTGLVAGTLGGLFSMAGPIIFIVLSRAGDDPSVFRRRTILMTTVVGFSRMMTLVVAGDLTRQHWEISAWMIPTIVTGLIGGMAIHHKIKPRPFKLALGTLVLLAGCGGLLKSIL